MPLSRLLAMLNSLTLKNKMTMLPDAVALTVTPANASIAAFAVAGGRQRPVTGAEIDYAANLGLSLPTRTFLIAVQDAGAYQVGQNDLITDASGQIWHVLTAMLELQGTIWRCLCKRAVN